MTDRLVNHSGLRADAEGFATQTRRRSRSEQYFLSLPFEFMTFTFVFIRKPAGEGRAKRGCKRQNQLVKPDIN